MEERKSVDSFDRVILVDKPASISSFGVVSRIRQGLTIEAGHKVKVGHTGTLDPFATGLLILLSGKFTKKSSEFLKLDKEYEAVIKLGFTSTTGDPEGEITAIEGPTSLRSDLVKKALQSFMGEITQTPPIYSAIKVNGQRAYKLARKGQDIEMPSRKVTIYKIDLLYYGYPLLKIRVKCSSGTYIRTLAEDIGKKLGTGAYCEELRRTKVGDYDVKGSIKLTDERNSGE